MIESRENTVKSGKLVKASGKKTYMRPELVLMDTSVETDGKALNFATETTPFGPS